MTDLNEEQIAATEVNKENAVNEPVEVPLIDFGQDDKDAEITYACVQMYIEYYPT